MTEGSSGARSREHAQSTHFLPHKYFCASPPHHQYRSLVPKASEIINFQLIFIFLFIRDTYDFQLKLEVVRAPIMSSQNSRQKQRQEALEIPLSMVLSKCWTSLSFYLVFKIPGEAPVPPLWLHKSPGLRNTKRYFACVILLDPELHSSVSDSFHPSVISGCLSVLWVEHFFHRLGESLQGQLSF